MMPRVSALVLAREEIRALPRQGFALGSVFVLLSLLAPFAALALHGPSAMRDYLMFLWVVGELVVGIVVAARVAAARRSRFVESLYTTPLEARAWWWSQVLVGVFLATLVLVVQLPFVLVHVALVGVPASFVAVLLAAVAMGVFAVALGLFCGVIVGDAGPGAAAGLAGGFGFVSFILLLVHGFAAQAPPTSTQRLLLHLSAVSPLSLVVDATGIDIFEIAPTQPWRAVAGLAALVAGLGGAAWLAYTRAQGPLGWEPRRGVRAPLVALVALALVVPVASASVSFRELPDESPWILSHGDHTRIAVVPRGTPIDDQPFGMRAYFEREALVHGADNELDVLVLLMLPAGEAARDVRIQVIGSDEMLVVAGGRLAVASGAPEGQARPGESFDETEPTGPYRPVYRVPVTLRPVEAIALLSSPGLVEIKTTFVHDGRAVESHARMTLESDVPGAASALLAAGAPLPLIALGALVTRRLKTR